VSFAAKVEKLMFTVGLTDKTAGPVGAINARIDKLTRNAEKGFRNVGYGAAGLTAAVFLLNRAMAPAIEQQRALNEVASLDVNPKALSTLNKMALRTQAQYGTASAAIIRSAYDIQSAIAGLDGNELSKFTKNSAILAKGTKADASVITSYMGTMYGIFKGNAEKMGNSAWVDQLTGQTASAVKMYKTTGSEMGAAFGSLGAEGQAALIPMHEQMAVLGKLQATMSGSEAGTKYKSFITNVGRAQKSLGLNFTDSAGRMLPIVQIMDKIKGKYGEIDTVAKSDIIQTAFGSEEAVALVKLLVKETAGLGTEIDNLGDVRGMETALKMAKAMTDPWQQLSGTAKSVHTAFSQALMPVLQPTIEKITQAGDTLLRWTDMFPKLTSAVSFAGLGIITLMGTIAVLTISVGIYRFAMVGLAVVHTALTGGIWVLTKSVNFLGAAYNYARKTLAAFYLLSKISGGGLAALRMIMLSLTTGVWAFTTALLANPITWVVVAVVALGAAVYGIVKYWDQLSSAVSTFLDNSIVFQILRSLVMVAILPIRIMWSVIKAVGAALFSLGGIIVDALDSFGVLSLINSGLSAMAGFFSGVGDIVNYIGTQIGSFFYDLINATDKGAQAIKGFADFIAGINPLEMLGKHIDWIIDKINLIPGISIDTKFSSANPAQKQMPTGSTGSSLLQPNASQKPFNFSQQTASNDSVINKQPFGPKNSVVPLKVDYQLAKNTANLPKGVGADFADIKQKQDLRLKNDSAQVTSLNKQSLQVPKGGLMNQFKQMNTETNNNSGMHVENVTIQTSKLDNAEALQQQLLVSVG
jgi:TP901 family phage tail tape measure protein